MAITLRDALINWAGRVVEDEVGGDDECCGGSPYDTREEERGR